MTTAIDLISRAMRLIGVYSIGETPSADEASTGLTALNAMLDSWSTQNLFVFAQSTDVIALTAGVSAYVVGPASSTTRPVDILDSSYILLSGVSYPLTVTALSNYNDIPLKADVSGIPTAIYSLMTVPNITVNLWPVPSQSMTLNLVSNKLISSFTGLATTVSLPPGYDRAIVFSLAEEIAAEYQVPVTPDVAKKAAYARKTIKRANVQIPVLKMPYGVPSGLSYQNYRLG
jgi:hypothetical protein